MIFTRLLISLACLASAQGAWAESGMLLETKAISDIENRPITFHIERFPSPQTKPVLLVIDGSGCGGALREGFSSLYRPSENQEVSFAKLTLTKPGIDPYNDDPRACSPEYRERFSIDRHVIDHLRVLQHLKTTADWWDGRLYVFGWSDGGDIGARLLAYYPNVERVALGAQGGGYTMAQHIEDFWDCAADRNTPTQRAECLAEMRGWFADVKAKPLASLGKQESYQLWRSRLFADLVPILADTAAPLLIVHGALDRDNTPVESARVLVRRLIDKGRPDLTYCEVPTMAHGTGSLPPEEGLELEDAILTWLFDRTDASARLGALCDPNPDLSAVAPPVAKPKEKDPVSAS